MQQVGTAELGAPHRHRQDEREGADWLAEQLGDLPLALAMAAAYIRTTGLGIKDYLRLFQQHSPALALGDSPLDGHERSVAGTVQLGIEGARQACPHVDALLNLCAFLAPEDLPLDLLLAGPTEVSQAPELQPLFDEETRRAAVAALCRCRIRRGEG